VAVYAFFFFLSKWVVYNRVILIFLKKKKLKLGKKKKELELNVNYGFFYIKNRCKLDVFFIF